MSNGSKKRRHDSKNLTRTPTPFLSRPLGGQEIEIYFLSDNRKIFGGRRRELSSALNPRPSARILARKPKKIKGNLRLISPGFLQQEFAFVDGFERNGFRQSRLWSIMLLMARFARLMAGVGIGDLTICIAAWPVNVLVYHRDPWF